jgi:stress response protein SCP2
MAVSLKKGEGVKLSKATNDLSRVTIGLGWDIATPAPPGFFAKLFGGGEPPEEYDLDVVAFLLDARGKVMSLGQVQNGVPTLNGGDVVFFNSQRHPSGQIWLTGDNRTGAGDGDDEQIVVLLDTFPAKYDRILFIVQIYQGIQKNQSFASVNNAFIRAVDAKGKEICRFDLSGNPSFANCRSFTFAELRRAGSEWTFNAIGMPHEGDSFVPLLHNHV